MVVSLVFSTVALAEDVVPPKEEANITNNYNFYYYDTTKEIVSISSLNNKDSGSYYRPKYEDISVPVKEYIELHNNGLTVNKNLFDADWSEIDKRGYPTSRALETLGYDLMLFDEEYNLDTHTSKKSIGYGKPITAPYLIMNIYKALGIELYDIYFDINKDTGECGVYTTRTNIDSYWKLFLNDHPIDYDVYNGYDITNTSTGRVLTNADILVILSQMLDYYGEPVISKQEEYMLLQMYSDEVPTSLEDSYRIAWSYLKCRGILGEDELDYNSVLTFDTMIDLLMKAKDTNSRTNFKEIQITTNLDDSFIRDGYYEDNNIKLINQVNIIPESMNIDFSTSTRIDFLLEIDSINTFKLDNGDLSNNLFISKGPLHNDNPINGSIYNGIVDKRFYHFSTPKAEIIGLDTLYVNSDNFEDRPLVYTIHHPTGGVYSKYDITDEDKITWAKPSTFNDILPNSTYVDIDRLTTSTSSKNTKTKVYAYPGQSYKINYIFDATMINTLLTINNVKNIGGEASIIKKDNKDYLSISIMNTFFTSYGITDLQTAILRYIVVKDEFISKSIDTKAIIGLTGDKLLISLKDAKEKHGLIYDYKINDDEQTIKIYAKNRDMIIVDNKNKTIQKGNTYLQIKEPQPLYKIDSSDVLVDFRALYGLKEAKILFSDDPATGQRVATLYSNYIEQYGSDASRNKYAPYLANTNGYTHHSTLQVAPYDGYYGIHYFSYTDLLFKYNTISNTSPTARDIEEVLLPFSSVNLLGNYILYGEASVSNDLYYLIRIIPKGVLSTSPPVSTIDWKTLFKFIPDKIPIDKYDIVVTPIKYDEATKALGVKEVPGVGWCYSVDIITNTNTDKKKFMNDYTTNKELLPFALYMDSTSPNLVNFNTNFFTKSHTTELTLPTSPNVSSSVIPAIVGVQALFTNPKLIESISYDTIKNNMINSIEPILYWGTMVVSYSETEDSLVTDVGSMKINDSYTKDGILFRSMNYQAVGLDSGDVGSYTGIYNVTSSEFTSEISTLKKEIKEEEINKKEIASIEFFNKFKDITFSDFIHGLDNSMSVLYYLVTRAFPLILLLLLTIILVISTISDIPIVQKFCDKVFDPIKLLTLGNYTILTIRNKFLIISLISALAIMGFIQIGNLEKIIVFFIKTYYAIMGFF